MRRWGSFFGVCLRLFFRKPRVNSGGLSGMQLVVILVGLSQPRLIQQETVETVRMTQFEFSVHLDGLERTDLNANLAAHANRNVDIEDLGVLLRAAFFVAFQDDVN